MPADLVAVDLESVNPELKGLRLRGRLEGNRLVPYWTRAEIESARRAFRAPVLAWVEDPVELFFLQIQGSGQIALDDGRAAAPGLCATRTAIRTARWAGSSSSAAR